MTSTANIKTLLAAIVAAEGVSPAPWTPDQDDETYWVETPQGNICDCNHIQDAQWIARSRTITPGMAEAWLEEIEWLEGQCTYTAHYCDVPEYSDGVNMGRATAADEARDRLAALVERLEGLLR